MVLIYENKIKTRIMRKLLSSGALIVLLYLVVDVDFFLCFLYDVNGKKKYFL